MTRTLTRRLAVATTAGLAGLLVASPALAHPSFNPNTVTTGERHVLDLVVPHGCTESGGAPADGEATSPTVALSVQVPAGVAFIAPHEAEGWSVRVSDTAFTWADAGGSTTAPIVFTVDVELQPDATGEIRFPVAQDCAEGSVLWNDEDGGPNPPAILVAGDAVGTTELDHSGDHGADGEHGDDADGEHDDMAGDGEHDDMADDHGDDAAGEHDMAEAGSDAEGSSLDPGLVLVTVLLLVGGMTAIIKMD